MSGFGTVLSVDRSTVPATKKAAQRVLVAQADRRWLAIFIPPGPAPIAGDAINWGPHHAWWGDRRVLKLDWEQDPDAPLR